MGLSGGGSALLSSSGVASSMRAEGDRVPLCGSSGVAEAEGSLFSIVVGCLAALRSPRCPVASFDDNCSWKLSSPTWSFLDSSGAVGKVCPNRGRSEAASGFEVGILLALG